MAWQRKIPFGYRIQNGKPTVYLQEAQAVRNIFNRYLAGASYSQIAAEMTQHGPRYHQHTEVWNKHMVKRILENETYLGGGIYPQLMEADALMAVRLQRSERNTFAPWPEILRPIRGKVLCAHCGARMERNTKTKGRPRWVCVNDSCRQSVCIGDDELKEVVTQRLRELAAMPHLLTMPQSAASPSADALRLERELTLSLNRGEMGELVKAMALAVAAESYASLADPTPAHRMEQLRHRLQSGPADAPLLAELLDAAVKGIHLGKGPEVDLELVNGTMIQHHREEASA